MRLRMCEDSVRCYTEQFSQRRGHLVFDKCLASDYAVWHDHLPRSPSPLTMTNNSPSVPGGASPIREYEPLAV